eukprot:CAMPEP_0183486208 /NCGR_PEP_ID=MMETSP0370-20130417/179817_1 /TAXON_ID=268820 /ORGANISM="Peridinium aciculiferum, Strain PAER-2" /LENGTH=752 /DNA_ID=CAMNT_0025679519 /DNA_START=81 /DNA_END=2340 /DNA_ORIENTATION=-
MKMVVRVLAGAALVATALADASSPVGKTLQLLADLQTKIIGEGEEAQKVYGEYSEWCEERSKELSHEIKTGKAEVAGLEATIDQEVSTIGSMAAKIEKLAGEISVDEADLKAATDIRGKESEVFMASEKELTEIIDTLQRAVGILEREMKGGASMLQLKLRGKESEVFMASEKELTEIIDTLQRAVGILEREMKGGASMLQLKGAQNLVQALEVLVQGAVLSTSDVSKLTAFVQASSDDEDVGAPAGGVYESHSGDIVQILTDLLEKAEEQLESARTKETQDLHAFEAMNQGLTDEIKFGNKEMSEAKTSEAAASEKKATAEGDLAMTSKDLSTDETGLGDLHHECMTRAEDFEAETKSRGEELAALAAAMHHECMTRAEDFEAETKSRGEELAALAAAKSFIKENVGAADDLSYSFLQVARTEARITSRAGLAQFEAARYIRDLAGKAHSTQLAQLAARMTSAIRASSRLGEDPFLKIKGLIQDMLEKLEKEAEEGATKKGICDKELAETNEKKADKTNEIEKLSTQVDKMSSRSAELKEEIAALEKALGELASGQAGMDKLRFEEKEIYTKNKADMEQGLEGVKMALKILREYYAKADKAHASADGASTGIIGLLEVVESDFTKGSAEMTAAEESAASTYDTESKENAIEKATKEQDVKYKTKESTELDATVAETSSDRSGVQAELDAVLEYLSKMEAQCVEKAETYGERKAGFEAELAGLKEGLRILESETAASLLQRGSLRGVKRHVA